MIILNKILYIYLPISLFVGFIVITICFYAAPITMSYYFNSLNHDPSHNANYIGMSIPLYYLISFLIFRFTGDFTLIKTGLISYGIAAVFFLVCLFGSFSRSFNLSHSNKIGGATSIILKPIELIERISKISTYSIRISHYETYILKPDVKVSAALSTAMREVESAAEKEANPEKKKDLQRAYQIAFDKINN